MRLVQNNGELVKGSDIYEAQLRNGHSKSIPYFEEKHNPVKHMMRASQKSFSLPAYTYPPDRIPTLKIEKRLFWLSFAKANGSNPQPRFSWEDERFPAKLWY